jgi:predicted transcriptional regulator
MKDALSRRERQIMDIVYRRGRASVADVHAELPDAPSYSAVRALMGTLLEKGHLSHQQDGKRYVYEPTVSPDDASVSALRRVVSTFFDGSPARAALALVADGELDAAELEALQAAIAAARAEGR